jgi:hypothetical protein
VAGQLHLIAAGATLDIFTEVNCPVSAVTSDRMSNPTFCHQPIGFRHELIDWLRRLLRRLHCLIEAIVMPRGVMAMSA